MSLEDILGETAFLYGYRQDWNDTLDIIADEHPISHEKFKELKKYGRLLSDNGPIRSTDRANYSLMILTQMVYDYESREAVDGDYLFMMINELRKKTKTLHVRSWLAPEHLEHPELTLHSVIKSFEHLAGLRKRFPDDVKKIRATFSENNWFLAQELSGIGYEVKARKLPQPVISDDGNYDFHEYIVEFNKI
jgi:hypothetical protein